MALLYPGAGTYPATTLYPGEQDAAAPQPIQWDRVRVTVAEPGRLVATMAEPARWTVEVG